jgi:hypothetical protein
MTDHADGGRVGLKRVLRRITVCGHTAANTPVEPWRLSHHEAYPLFVFKTVAFHDR